MMVLTTFLTLILGCGSARHIPDPRSFVYIRTQSVEDQEDCADDNCPIRIITSSGSGSVIGHDGDNTYVLTAGHVCEMPKPSVSMAIAIDNEGNSHDVEKSRYSKDPDLCIMKSAGTWGRAMQVSDKPLKYGDRVMAMSAPNGIFSKNMIPLFDGMYSGNLDAGDSVYTIPAMAGSSGSAILNDDLEVVSVIHSAAKGFQHVAIGSSTEMLNKFIESNREFMNGRD